MNEKNNRPPQSPTGDVIQAHLGRFMAELSTAGYTANTFRAKRVALDRFLRWRHRRKRPALDLSESEIGDFLTNSFAGDRSRRSVASRALFGFLAYLRGCRVLRTAAPKRPKADSVLAARYADFLRHDKGLAELSLKVYLPVVKDLLGYLKEEHRLPTVRRLDATILCLELGDLRWRTGEILIRGKGSQQDLLPLPRDVGAAIARYLRRDRGVRTTRRVFLRTIAPRVPLAGPASIGHIVRRAMVKAGVERPRQVAAHLFRHTLASRMLHRGAHLREISQVLRHRTLVSTQIYAKIDLGSLQAVVRPWPTAGGAR